MRTPRLERELLGLHDVETGLMHMISRLPAWSVACVTLGAALPTTLTGQSAVIRGGHVFDSVRDHTVPNTGIVVEAGKLLEVVARLEGRDLRGGSMRIDIGQTRVRTPERAN